MINDANIIEATGAKTINSAWVRIQQLGYTQVCNRCQGSGHYSRNARGCTLCYECSGRCFVRPTVTVQMLNEIRARVAAGELKEFEAMNTARIAGVSRVQPLVDAWQSAYGSYGLVEYKYNKIAREFVRRLNNVVQNARRGYPEEAIVKIERAVELLAQARQIVEGI